MLSRQRELLSIPTFRRLWASSLGYALSFSMERIAIGWFVFDMTGSIFLTALSFAPQKLSNMLFAPIAGVVADRFNRSRLLALVGYCGGGVLFTMALVILINPRLIWLLLILTGIRCTVRTFELPTMQAFVTEIVGPQRSTNAVGIYQFGVRVISIVGGMGAGLLIEHVGPASAFMVAGAGAIAGSLTVRRVHTSTPTQQPRPRPVLSHFLSGLRAMLASQTVRILLSLTLLVEVFAFSHESLLPVFAHDIYEVGPSGLGTLALFGGLGAIAGSLILATIGRTTQRHQLLVVVTISYGVFLILLATVNQFLLALAIVAGIGAMSTLFDSLQWVLLQANVPSGMEGRAVSGWLFAMGLGWVGPLILGGIGEVLGAPAAVGIGGSLVILVGVIALVARPRLHAA